MKMNEQTQEKIQNIAAAFAGNKYIQAISRAMMFIITPIIIGSIFTLLANLPIQAYTDFLSQHGITPILNLPATFTTNIMAVLAVFFIAYFLAKQFDKDGTMAGMLALISFFIITPLGEQTTKDGTVNYIPFDWLGAKGLFAAMLVGLLTARLYVWFMDKGFTIKMPDSVPPAVSTSFAGLVPGFAVSIIALLVAAVFKATPYGSLDQLIYTCIQIPLQGLPGTFGAFILVNLIIGILWFFGIHGTNIVLLGVMYPLYLALDMQNLNAYQAGQALPNILGYQFFVCYVIFSGTGATIGLVLLMAFKAKSKQYRTLGRLALPTSIFNINEPVTFGTPIVLNPYMLIPYLLAPIMTGSIAYAATAIGLVPRLNGVQIPWSTPIIASGIIEGSWRIAVLQVVLVAVSLAVYYIPFKFIDKKAYEQEHADENVQNAQEAEV